MPDPTTFPDRACRGVPLDVFFPSRRKPDADARAKAICAGCPRLAACAAWAIPEVLAGRLSYSITAGVPMPPLTGGGVSPRKALREEAAAALAEVVRTARPIRLEGAA
nr:WhiB family transcriptional regulator [Nocardia bovistercoris]